MKNFYRILLLCLGFVSAFSGCVYARPAVETAAEIPHESAPPSPPPPPILVAPESVTQGDILSVFVNARLANRIREVSAELAGSTGEKVLSFTGFRFPPWEADADTENPAQDSDDIWAALGGISSVQAPGNYSLGLLVRSENGEETFLSAAVTVTGRNFVREDIPLNQAMSSLRADPNPLKTAEARELWAILSGVNTASVYHTGVLTLPTNEIFRETSFFGDRRTFLYTDGGKASSVHYGIDYATPRGTPVYAAGAGKIVMAKERVLTGLSIVIEHLPGVYSIYYHLDKMDVREGQLVKTGDKIGDSGFTGLATGPHLHWEVRVATNAVEPKTLLTRPLIPK